MFEFRLIFHWGPSLRVQLKVSHDWSANGLTPGRWQVIIWTNDGLIYWPIYVPLGLNGLNGGYVEQNMNALYKDVSKLMETCWVYINDILEEKGSRKAVVKTSNKSDSEQCSRQAMRWGSKWNEYKNSAEGYIHIDPITSLIVPPTGISHQTFIENSTYFRYQSSKTSVNNNTNRPSKWYVWDKHPTRHKMAWVTYMP